MIMEYGVLYILGAGASIGAKRIPKDHYILKSRMPSGPNFFYDCGLFDAPKEPGLEFLNVIPFMYEGLNQIIEKSWRLDSEIQTFEKEEWKGVNVEDVFTFLDTGEKLYHKNSNVYKAFKSAKKSLIDYICIEISLRSLGERCEYLEGLFKNISERDSIFSFNWDTITETTLEYLNLPHYENYLNLCSNNKFKISEYSKKCILLKLHGSINWMICTDSECLMYKKNQLILSDKSRMLKDLGLGDFNKCESCGRSFIKNVRNIIPPTSNKISIHQDSYMHRIWLLAREKLRFFKKLVFIGYSFPNTDFYSEWLFRQINFLQYHDGNNTVIDIDIVNPEIFDESSITYSRYHKIFRGHRIKKYRNLREYVKKIA
jgi:hypothetical protein